MLEMLKSHLADDFDEEGLSAEEMALAKELLEEKVSKAAHGMSSYST